MTTPRAYLWQTCVKRAEGIDDLGGVVHYYTEEAQTFYLKDGIASKELTIERGHWQDATAGEEVNINENPYSQMSLTHPATGSVYGTLINVSGNLFFMRYQYAKDVGMLVQSGNYRAQVDSPIVQVNSNIKNFDTDAFTKDATLFMPGAKVDVGIMMGDSAVFNMCRVYLDQVDFEYNKNIVAISGRNVSGHFLNDQTMNIKGKKTDQIDNLVKWVLESIGITDYIVQENTETMTLEYRASDTPLKLLQSINDTASGVEDGTDWDIEEMPNGTLVVGFNAFRGTYFPKTVFKFGMGELFKRQSQKSIDGAYSKIYVTGKTSAGTELDPVIKNVTTWQFWTVAENKTYFPPTLENTTQEELEKYASTLAKQIKRTGLHEGYVCNIRPQLLVGDYATIGTKDIGIINEITHSFGEKGFQTEFVADSGGDKKSLLTRSLEAEEHVYTSARRNKGTNRNQRLIDFIKSTATEITRSSGGTSGGGGNVDDVKVNDVSVVQNKIAKITSYKEVTQQEYDNLPASKTSDGVAYFIKDASGGGGASALADLDDVSISSQTDGQVLKYNSTSQKWENANESGGAGHNYSTTEQVIGTWIDGKPIYEKTFETTSPSNSNTDISIADITNLNIDSVISTNGYCLLTSDYFIPLGFYGSSTSHVLAYSTKTAIICNAGSPYVSKAIKVTIQYTKTTD